MSNILNRLFDFELKEENKLTAKYLFCWALISFVVLITLQAWYLYQDNYLPFTLFCAPVLFIAIVDFDMQPKRSMLISALHLLHIFFWFVLFVLFKQYVFFSLKLSVWFSAIHLALTFLYLLLPIVFKSRAELKYKPHIKAVFILLSVQIILILILKIWAIQFHQVWPNTTWIKSIALYMHLINGLIALFVLIQERKSINRIKKRVFIKKLPSLEHHSEWVLDLEFRLDKHMRTSKIFLNAELSLDDLCKELGVQRHRLSHYLNEYLGLTFYEWLGSYRVSHAMELLKGKGEHWKLEILAHECGYQSKTTFIKHFKNTLGVTPSQFRFDSL